jgi:hypothetical protein
MLMRNNKYDWSSPYMLQIYAVLQWLIKKSPIDKTFLENLYEWYLLP